MSLGYYHDHKEGNYVFDYNTLCIFKNTIGKYYARKYDIYKKTWVFLTKDKGWKTNDSDLFDTLESLYKTLPYKDLKDVIYYQLILDKIKS